MVTTLRFVLFNPIAAGETGIEHAVFDVAGHFLRADEHALHFGIVHGREIRAAASGDVVSGAAEEIDGGRFQATFRDAQFQLH